MKKTNLVLVLLYFLFVLYYAIFNWSVFVADFNIDVGFTVISMSLIAFVFFVGLIIAVFQWVIAIISDLANEKRLSKKNEEINSVKAAFYDENNNQLQKINDSLEQLFTSVDGLSKQISNKKDIVKELPLKESDIEKTDS
ncbi:MAG: hypothetical protein KKA19_06200 [Candidatus Margulisbacteria bacterium]|nr:hypothetical protein [Candidatus Margulisiibacteriota bacterium]